MSAQDGRDRPRVVCVGEVLWDCFLDRRILGGAPLNCAYMLQSLGATAVMISRIGDDDDGQAILEVMKFKGMDTSFVQIDRSHPTGRVLVALGASGEPTFTIVEDAAWDYLEWQEALAPVLAQCDAVCFGSLAQRNPCSRGAIASVLARAQRAVRVFDVNLRQHYYTPEILAEGLSLARIVKLNDEELAELRAIFPESFRGGVNRFMEEYDIELLAVTKGAEGCTLYRGDQEVTLPGKRVEVADTVGSGDAFAAALLLSYLQGAGLSEMGEAANRLGAYVATQQGATPSLRPYLRRS